MEGRLLRLERKGQGGDYSEVEWHVKNGLERLGVAISPHQIMLKPAPLVGMDISSVSNSMRTRRDLLIDRLTEFLGTEKHRGKEDSPGTAWYDYDYLLMAYY